MTAPTQTVTLHLTSSRTVLHKRKDITLHTYQVRLDDQPVGTVAREMVTRESRTPGKVYVNRRWQSPAWRGYHSPGRGLRERETRVEAITDVLAHALGKPTFQVDDLAKTATVAKPSPS